MSTHLTDKEIDNYISGLASRKAVKHVAVHLDSCGQCRADVNKLMSVIAEQESSDIPGDHVRASVLAEWYRLHNEAVVKHEEKKTGIRRLAGSIAFAASIVIVISGYMIFSTIKSRESYPLALNNTAGEVYLNDSRAVVTAMLKAGDVIKTGDDASVLLSFNGYSLFIGRSSILELLNNDKGGGLRFKLREGSVISKSSGTADYSFECGGYSVIPEGTEFMLHFSGDKLTAAVSQGSVAVTGFNLKIKIPAGMIWSSDNSGAVTKMDEKLSLLMNSDLQGVWPDKKVLINEKVANAEVKNQGNEYENKNDTLVDDEISNNNKKDKTEKLRIKREIREDSNEMKREQRREKKGKGSD
jgi:hypothetical protein